MFSSESVALDQLGFINHVDIKPGMSQCTANLGIFANACPPSTGEAVVIRKGHKPTHKQVHPQLSYAPDIFEYVYFARPDTVIDGISVHRCRQNMGVYLAKTIKQKLGDDILKTIDLVIPIPETSNTSALAVSQHLNIPFSPAFIKNRYIFRTFIMPGQKLRQKTVRRKLNAMRTEFEGRNVLLVDDSIVRGTTSKEIVQMARDAGAKKVYFASCAPPIR